MTDREPISKEAQEAADSFDIRGCAAHQGYLRGYISGAKKVEELREVIRELLPIAEHRLSKIVNYSLPDYQQRRNKVQAIIDRAKKLV